MTLLEQDRLRVTRRGVLVGTAFVVATLALGPLAELLSKLTSRRKPNEIVISDPMQPELGEPLDLSADTRIKPIVDELTESNKGIISYRDFLRTIVQERVVMYGESYFNDTDKVALCEIINAAKAIHPGRGIILTLGRFQPEDNKALEDFINNHQLSESEALEALQKNSTYDKEWNTQPLNDTDPGRQYGKTLLLCRRWGIRLVATGVDRGLSSSKRERTPEQIIETESKAAQVIYNLVVQNPSALIIGQMGRPYITRDQQGQSTTQQLERLLEKVVVVQTGDPSFADSTFLAQKMNLALGETLEHHKNILNNSAFATVEPKYSSARLDQFDNLVRGLPGADFLLARYYKNAWST